MNLLAAAIAPNAPRFSSAVQQINHPVHQGRPNPAHGMFFIVGSIPDACYDESRNGGRGGSMLYPSEQAAIEALQAAGAPVIQGVDCRVIN
jgi:hypothetical protein